MAGSGKDALAEREKALEDKFFEEKEKELLQKIRERSAGGAERDKLAAATGISNEEVLRSLQDLGYTSETIKLLHLVPLLYVAWSDGKIQSGERKLILDMAALRGVKEGMPAYARLLQSLDNRPSDSELETSLRVVRLMLESLPEREREASKANLIAYSTAVAGVSGSLLGLGSAVSDDEKKVIEQMKAEFTPAREKAAKRVLGH